MSLKIVDFEESMLNAIYEVEKSAFKKPWSKNSFLEELKNPLAKYFVLFYDDELIGYIGFWHIFDEGHITNIAIKKEYTGRGLSNQLMQSLFSYYEENKMEILTLEVRQSNIVAQNLYKKYNFVNEGIRKNYYENSENAIIMTYRRNK